MAKKKSWTVLIYANGNNDLDENIYREFELLKDAEFSEDINVVVQLSRLPKQTDNQCGICRYIIKDKEARLIKNIGRTSMADSAVLLDFLIWGNEYYPSEHLVVILSGHGFGFVGLLCDQLGNSLYIMSIQAFSKTLSEFRIKTDQTIDVLVFDTCYMNLIEVLYELAVTSGDSVRYSLLSQGNPPLEGLSWRIIINGLEAGQTDERTADALVCGIVRSLNRTYDEENPTFALRMICNCFVNLKVLTDQLAEFIYKEGKNGELTGVFPGQRDSELISISFLLDQMGGKFSPIETLSREIRCNLNHIVLCPGLDEIDSNSNLGLSIYMPDNPKQYLVFKKYYEQMLFYCNNRWLKLIKGESVE